MQKTKEYTGTRFPPDVIRQAIDAFSGKNKIRLLDARVQYRGESWTYDTVDEFLAEYLKGETCSLSAYILEGSSTTAYFRLFVYRSRTDISVTLQTRAAIESVFNVFESN